MSDIGKQKAKYEDENTQGNCTTVYIGNKLIRWLIQTVTVTRTLSQGASPGRRDFRMPACA
jgi:virulence-associated protein VapD